MEYSWDLPEKGQKVVLTFKDYWLPYLTEAYWTPTVRGWTVPPPNLNVEVPAPSISECDFILGRE